MVTVLTRSLWRTGIVLSAWSLAITATVLGWLSRDVPTPPTLALGPKAVELVFPIAAMSLVFVGVLTTTRFPRHVIAWLFISMGFAIEWMMVAQNYGLYATAVTAEPLPGGDFALWASTWTWAPASVGFTLIFLLFPDGRPPSPRWWWIVWFSLLNGLIAVYQTVFTDEDAFTNTVWTLGWAASTIAAMAALVIRFRQARGDERQQLKWFAYPSAIATTMFVLGAVFWGVPDVGPSVAGAAALSVLLIPVGAAIAILKYRLYDIDMLFRRTVVYTMTTVALTLSFLASIYVLEAVLQPVTGGPEIAVAIATLLSLALFQPLRERVQRGVDRRFYRTRYDAARTVDDFIVRVRDEVDLDAVRRDLVSSIDQTVQPSSVSLWLRESPR